MQICQMRAWDIGFKKTWDFQIHITLIQIKLFEPLGLDDRSYTNHMSTSVVSVKYSWSLLHFEENWIPEIFTVRLDGGMEAHTGGLWGVL